MKANELMIGDWVQIDEPDKYAGARGTICSLMHHHSDEGCYFHVFVQDLGVVMREVFNEDLRPIPLTAEILEKNGFERSKVFVEWKYENDNVYMIYKPFPYLRIEMEECIVAFPCEYIHELQHALRLCGITHEISL